MTDMIVAQTFADTLWQSTDALVFGLALTLALFAMAVSKSLAVGFWGAFLVFAHVALETRERHLMDLLIASTFFIIIAFAFKVLMSEFGGDA